MKESTQNENTMNAKQYRNADIQRWQTMDFVLGYKINRSRNCDPDCEICKAGQGDFPKSFDWDGWHEGCKCYLTPIMVEAEEMDKVNQAFLKGQKYTPKGQRITDIPVQLKQYAHAHPECKSSNWYQNNQNCFI